MVQIRVTLIFRLELLELAPRHAHIVGNLLAVVHAADEAEGEQAGRVRVEREPLDEAPPLGGPGGLANGGGRVGEVGVGPGGEARPRVARAAEERRECRTG